MTLVRVPANYRMLIQYTCTLRALLGVFYTSTLSTQQGHPGTLLHKLATKLRENMIIPLVLVLAEYL